MEYLIGMDGGGTKTRCIITDLDGKILYECTGNASNFLVKGTKEVSETLFGLIKNCKDSLGIEYGDIKVVLIGTTGAGRKNDAETLQNAFIEYSNQKGIKFNLFRVESDARIAIEGAFPGKPGSILISGTGSIMFGKDAGGNIHRVGGFGRYLGDEGSGYVIGKKGLVLASKDYDGRGEHSFITKLLADHFKIDSQESLINAVYKNNFDIASTAPLVFEAAEMNDPGCQRIVEEETNELLMHITAMAKKINQPVLDLVLLGGIISSDNIFSRTLLKKIQEKLLHINVRNPEKSPAEGAVLMAKEFLAAAAH